MKQLRNYISIRKKPSVIQAINDTLREAVHSEIERLGENADLNHIDVSECTGFGYLFLHVDFQGDVSKWDMHNAIDTIHMFNGCKNFNCDLSEWSLDSIVDAESMFLNCYALTTTPELPAETLSKGIYENMFKNCRSLETPPELPATKLENLCYKGMFMDCTSLKSMPKLPATELAIQCYHGMFYGCKNLKKVFDLPATKLAKECYSAMFYGCESLERKPKYLKSYGTSYDYLMFVNSNFN